jgi:hypothetical protein
MQRSSRACGVSDTTFRLVALRSLAVSLHRLEHDHSALSQAVSDLRTRIDSESLGDEFIQELRAVADDLFEHFAREEEGLFPFIAEALPDQIGTLEELQVAHDRICGAAARILAVQKPELGVVLPLFRRFDAEYTGHARREVEFLRSLESRLSESQRAALAKILAES